MRTAIQNRSKNSSKSSETISIKIWEKIFRQDFRDLHKDFPNRGGSKSGLYGAVELRSLYTVLRWRPVDPRPPLRDSCGLLTLTCGILKTDSVLMHFRRIIQLLVQGWASAHTAREAQIVQQAQTYPTIASQDFPARPGRLAQLCSKSCVPQRIFRKYRSQCNHPLCAHHF